MRTIKLCSAVFGVVVSACCHKQDSLMHGSLCDKHTSKLSTINYSMVEIVDHTPPVIDLNARYWSQIAIFAYPISPSAFDASVRARCRNIAITFGMEKLEWCGYVVVTKF